jgi:hypothetical protein
MNTTPEKDQALRDLLKNTAVAVAANHWPIERRVGHHRPTHSLNRWAAAVQHEHGDLLNPTIRDARYGTPTICGTRGTHGTSEYVAQLRDIASQIHDGRTDAFGRPRMPTYGSLEMLWASPTPPPLWSTARPRPSQPLPPAIRARIDAALRRWTES